MAAETGELALELPLSVVTRIDVGRLIRETEAVDNFLRQAAMRQPGSSIKLPKTSRLFDEIVTVNKLNMLQEQDRHALYAHLSQVRTEAPVLHMSFSTDPSPMFLQKLVTWLRHNIHPVVLLQVGLLPNIGAGCVVRTTNKYFDFSLQQRFTEARPMLISKLQGAAVTAPTGDIAVPAEPSNV